MSRPRTALNADDLIQPRRNGQRIHDLPVAEIVQAYLAGTSVNALAKRYGVSRPVIGRRLAERSVPMRSQSEAEKIKWANMSQRQRKRQVQAAHAASRGRIVPIETKIKTARTVAKRGEFGSVYERQLHQLLEERGVRTVPQMAIGPYNCDLGTSSVAVEVYVGGWHWTGRHLRRLPERVDYIFNASFHVLVVWLDKSEPVTAEMADYVAAYIKSASADPPTPREYRVIRGTGEAVALASSDSDDRTLIPTLGVAANARS